MRAERLGQVGLVVLAVGLVAAGLATVGGPGKGRTEAQDRTRLSDLQNLSHYVECVADAQGKRLPDTLATVEACKRALRLADPFTGEAYRYERLSDTAFRLCARFSGPDGLSGGWSDPFLDAETGCLTHPYRP